MTSPCSVCGRDDGEHDDPFLEALEPGLARFRDTLERRQSLELLKVIRLAPTLEVAEALLRGERVPRSKLDPLWLEAYGNGQ